MKDVWSYILIGVLSALLIGGSIYTITKINSLNKEAAAEKRKTQYWNDSLRVVQNELETTYEKYAIEKQLNKRLIVELSQKVKTIFRLTSSIYAYESEDKDTLFAFHSPTYKDSGVTISLKDSIWFIKQKNSIWKSEQKAEIEGSIDLLQTVGRDTTGNFFGSVTTKSKIVTIANLRTIVDDKWLPPLQNVDSSVQTPLHTFGFASDLDAKSSALGIVINVPNWQFGLKYVIFSREKSLWHENLRVGIVYYIL